MQNEGKVNIHQLTTRGLKRFIDIESLSLVELYMVRNKLGSSYTIQCNMNTTIEFKVTMSILFDQNHHQANFTGTRGSAAKASSRLHSMQVKTTEGLA